LWARRQVICGRIGHDAIAMLKEELAQAALGTSRG
jgi:hypothetical protein